MASLIKRNNTYYLQWYEAGKQRRVSLRTDSMQIAKEKKRQFESAQFAGHGCALPTRTPVGQVSMISRGPEDCGLAVGDREGDFA